MNYRFGSSVTNHACILMLILVTGCSESDLDGGGIGLGGDVVPPYPGTWVSEFDDEIDFESAGRDAQYFSTRYEITARVRDPTDRCGIPMDGFGSIALEGTMYGDRITLYTQGTNRDSVCLSGTFTDMITLDATLSDGSSRQYRGTRVQVNLNQDNGIWISDDDAANFRIIFIDPNAVNNNNQSTARGCILPRDVDINLDLDSDAIEAIDMVRISGSMRGFQTETNELPRIDSLDDLVTGEPVFTDMIFTGPNTLSGLTAEGAPITLHRIPAPVPFDSVQYDICSSEDFP